MSGRVIFAGAGPGAADLITVRAVKALAQADVVLHDALVTPEVLAYASLSAEIISVGKRCGRPGVTQAQINDLLVGYAAQGKRVVRLKCGDPAIFGRLAEEIEALREAGIEFEIVPGVTAAVAAAATAGVSLSRRYLASQIVFITASLAEGRQHDWRLLLQPNTTIAVYMPGPDYTRLAGELLAAGVAPGLPVAIVANAGIAEGAACVTTVGELAQQSAVHAPAVLLVGAGVAGAKKEAGTLVEALAGSNWSA